MAQKQLNKNFAAALLYVLVGILFIAFRGEALNWMLTVIGVLFLVDGVLALVRRDTIAAAVGLTIGLLVILGGWLFVQIILFIFGALLIAKGVLALLESFQNKTSIIPLLSACGTLVVGILLIVSGGKVLDWLFIIVGVLFILDGILSVLEG